MLNLKEIAQAAFEEVLLGFLALVSTVGDALSNSYDFAAQLLRNDMVRLALVWFVFLMVYLFA